MDRGAWRATVHGVAKSRTRLSTQHTQLTFLHQASGLFLHPYMLSGCLDSRVSKAPRAAWQEATHHLPRRAAPYVHVPQLPSSHHQF